MFNPDLRNESCFFSFQILDPLEGGENSPRGGEVGFHWSLEGGGICLKGLDG